MTIFPSSYLMLVELPSVLGHKNVCSIVSNTYCSLVFVVDHLDILLECNVKLIDDDYRKTTGVILLSQINSDARISSRALSEIESRHQDIICLEASIKELHEIFADTAMLLEIQVRWLPHLEMLMTTDRKGIH